MATTDVEFHVRVILEASGGKLQAQMTDFSSRVTAAGASMVSGLASSLATMSKYAAGFLVAGLAYGIKSVVQEGLRYNAMLEAGQNQIATTLRMFSHVSGGIGEASSAAEQFAANLEEAKGLQTELISIADASPGSYEQITEMFTSMLPSARSVTSDMQVILDLTRKSALMGGVMGGEFALAGRQLGQVIGGSAGIELQSWRLLKKPIADVMAAGGIEGVKAIDGMQPGKFTEWWNKTLTGEQRIELLGRALKKLGPEVADVYAVAWEGATSTAISKMSALAAEMAGPLFTKVKEFVVDATSMGFLAPGSEGYENLRKAADFFGQKLGIAGESVGDHIEDLIYYIGDNYEAIWDKGVEMFRLAMRAAQMWMAAKVGAGAAGLGIAAVGGAGKVAGGALSLYQAASGRKKGGAGKGKDGDLGDMLVGLATPLMTFGAGITSIGLGLVVALPLILVMATALAGVFVIGAGLAAWLTTQWDSFVDALKDGSVTLDPILDLVDLLWVKLVALGGALMGDVSGADSATTLVNLLTQGLYGMMGAMSLGVRTVGYVYGAYMMLTNGLMMVYAAVTAIAEAIPSLLGSLLAGVGQAIAQVSDTAAAPLIEAAAGLKGAASTVAEHRDRVVDDAKGRIGTFNKMMDAADAFDNAFATGPGVTEGLRAEIKDGSLFGGGGAGAQGTNTKPPKGPKTEVNIHSLTVIQDLRNEDPDRIMGAFVEKLADIASHPTSAATLPEFGA